MKTTNLELSEQLKEAGAKQESKEAICLLSGKVITPDYCISACGYKAIDCIGQVSSFDCHELLERLPYLCHVWKVENEFIARALGIGVNISFRADTPAEALGKLKLWCLQNGYCKC